MKKWIALICILIFALCALWPSAAFTEDDDTVLLARAIYALARDEGYDTKLAIGALVMNRVDNPWFSDTLEEVLTEQHQFPIGRRYDAECLNAAHDVLTGKRVLDARAVYYQSTRATERRADAPMETVGGYDFYMTDSEV